jgi:hypothetical protein
MGPIQANNHTQKSSMSITRRAIGEAQSVLLTFFKMYSLVLQINVILAI